jgi:hypothetical protein
MPWFIPTPPMGVPKSCSCGGARGVVDDELMVGRACLTWQTDYWDSINLRKGQYEQVPLSEGVKDFLDQVSALG